MAQDDKTQFILRKKHLPVRELAAQTGLAEEEVAQILQGGGEGEVGPAAAEWRRELLWPAAGLLVFLTLLCYLPVLKNGFVNWDDKDAILDNVQIRRLDPSSLKWMFTTYATGNWMPLTWLSFALNFRMGGLDPVLFHATNVLLHALNGVLVFLFSFRFLKAIPESGTLPGFKAVKARALPAAFLTALMFGLHPLHVESVAWATERKDVLYAFFYLGALFLYLGRRGPGSGEKKGLGACLALYALSLMSKPMAVTLPFVFLLLDGWPLGRFPLGLKALLREKAAFFILALGSAAVTMASHAKSLSYAQSGVEFYWILNAFRAPVFYLLKMVLPWDLSPYYPFPPEIGPLYLAGNFLAAAAVIGASVLFFRLRKRAPWLLAAWTFYLLSLSPVLGFVQTGSQAAADRYTYLPSLALFLPLSAAALRWISGDPLSFGGLCFLLVSGLGSLTLAQIGVWRNTEALWERVVRVYPGENGDAYSRLGAAYLKARRYDEALTAFSRAAVIPPPLARTYHGLGTALVYKDRIPEAIQAFDYALTLDPQITGPRVNLWNVYERLGRHEEAALQMKEALKVEPDSALFFNNLGVSCGFLRKDREAAAAFERAHRLDPDNPEYLVNLATIDQWEGQGKKALDLYGMGIGRNPREPVYYLKMADLYLAMGKKSKALEKLQEGFRLNPQNPKVVQQMGEDFEKLGLEALAQQCFSKAKALGGERVREE